MILALAIGLLWIVGCLLAVTLCVASRRIDQDLATVSTRPTRQRGATPRTDRFARPSFG